MPHCRGLGVNISSDGRWWWRVCDGSIRCTHGDGRELMALYVLADSRTGSPGLLEGFYGATAGAFGVLHWHVNRGLDAARRGACQHDPQIAAA